MSELIISLFNSYGLQRRSPRFTYAFGDSPPQLGNIAKAGLIREKIVNIWWRGSADEILGDVTKAYPGAYFQGTLTEDGQLLVAADQKPLPLRGGRILPPFVFNGPIPYVESAVKADEPAVPSPSTRRCALLGLVPGGR